MEAKRRHTLQDVARLAEVSQATVSLVLNGVAGSRVSDATRRRVAEAAHALGYRRAARVRADERLGSVIALVIDDLAASPFAIPFLEGAREAAWEHRCVVSVISTRSDAGLESAAIEAMLAVPAIGLVFATLLTRAVKAPLLGPDTPTVLLNCYDADDDTVPAVLPDDRGGARQMTRALIAAGHRRIGHLAGEDWLDAGRSRLEGYRDALETAGLRFDPALARFDGSSIAAARAGAHALLDLPETPTALFCFNDRMALGALDAARERGLRVPSDLSIVGFDDDALASGLFPGGLTTALLPHEAMARWAVERIVQARHAKSPLRPKRVLLPCPLVRRQSIARPVGAAGETALRA